MQSSPPVRGVRCPSLFSAELPPQKMRACAAELPSPIACNCRADEPARPEYWETARPACRLPALTSRPDTAPPIRLPAPSALLPAPAVPDDRRRSSESLCRAQQFLL